MGHGECSRYGSPYVVTGTSKRKSSSSRLFPTDIHVYFDETKSNVTGLDRLCEAVDLVSQGDIDDRPRKGRKSQRLVKDNPRESSTGRNQGSFQNIASMESALIGPFRAIRVRKVIDAYSLPNPVTYCQSHILGLSHLDPSRKNMPGFPFSLVPPSKYLNRTAVPQPLVEHSII